MERFTQDAGSPSKRPPSLLIVEDTPDHWRLMELAFRQLLPKSQLVWANTPQMATAYLDNCLATNRLLPSLILLDLYLPERTQGWQVLQAIKQHARYQSIPVIVVSHSNNSADISETYHHGGNSFITKPLDFSQWAAYLESLKMYWCDAVTLPNC